jgi:alpha-ketoglutaric semialdehyde dehydrogenase
MSPFIDATVKEIDHFVEQSQKTYQDYRKLNLKQRADFLRVIAEEMKAVKQELLSIAHTETHLSIERLDVEFKRTLWQLTSYADACEKGAWLDIRIDTAIPERKPPKPDLRKYLVPIGPVVVFGSSNFPFAYSTAGGDTACALAAGCPVLLKAHPAHAETSEMVASAIKKAATKCSLSTNIFLHIHGASFKVGEALIKHPLVKAVGFTGSLEGGMSLYKWAAERKEPIPVFAEMGSINPVFLFSEKLERDSLTVANMYASSITQSAGQFCTNPGLMVGIKGPGLERFIKELSIQIEKVKPEVMLHPGIAKNFHQNRKLALQQPGVSLLAETTAYPANDQSIPSIGAASARTFLENPQLHKEVFGPWSLLIICDDIGQMTEVAKSLEGQLTTTVIGTMDEIKQNMKLIDHLKLKCGRMIYNSVPTGVEVALSMHHGGPFPATTDSRFTAVGADGIKRFARAVCFQGWPDELLPPELQNANPLKIWRTVNNELTNKPIMPSINN